MNRPKHRSVSSSGARMVILAVGLSMMLAPAIAQSRRKTPAKPVPQEKADPLAPLLEQAKESIDKSDFAGAVEPLQKYIAQRPDEPYPHFQLGYSYAGLKRSADAKAEFSRAIALDPKMAAAHQNLGLVLMDTDALAASDAFRHAAELQPTESRPRFLTGYSLERAGKFGDAITQYREASAISPKDYEIHFALGRTLYRIADLAGAEVEFREAVAIRTDAAPAHLGLANSLLAQKKYELAADAFDGYLKLSPNDRSARFDRASALFNLDRYDDALTELEKSETGSSPSAETLKMRGDIYMQQKKWKEAGNALTQAIQLSPRDAELAAWLGHVDVELRDFPAAINILTQVHQQNPKSADALRDLVSAFFLSDNYSAALDAMDRLAKLETPKTASWFVRAICYDKLSQMTEAVESYQKFVDLDNGQHDTESFQARRRILALQNELKHSPKKQKK